MTRSRCPPGTETETVFANVLDFVSLQQQQDQSETETKTDPNSSTVHTLHMT